MTSVPFPYAGSSLPRLISTKELHMERMRSALARLRRWGQLKADAAQNAPITSTTADAAAFLHDILTRFPYTDEARRWLSTAISSERQDLISTRGGGFLIPDQNRAQLFTAHDETAIPTLAD